MNLADPAVQPFDAATAREPELEALHAFTSRLRAELMPDDPPTPLAEAVAVWRQAAATGDSRTWLVREGGAVVARAQLARERSEANRHVASGQVEVLPERRGRGLARVLLACVAEAMRGWERSVLLGSTLASAPIGAALAERMGAARGLETTVYQLRLDALDPARLARRLAPRDAEAFELGFWDGPHAEADLGTIADLYLVMGTQPMGTLAIEHPRFTPDDLRRIEAALAARGRERWTAWVRERASGRLAGFTEVFLQPSAPRIVHQGNTGVFPEYRGRGLGGRLKAAMLDRIVRERPEARLVRTSTADSNDAMRALNAALGFVPYTTRTIWQAELAGIERWLGRRR